MKVRELIAELQTYDSETEVCVDNKDIYFLEPKPAYWDGRLERLIIDERGKLIGARVVEQGNKVNITAVSIHDLLWDHPNLPIDLSGLSHPDEWAKRVAGWRTEVKDFIQQMEKEST